VSDSEEPRYIFGAEHTVHVGDIQGDQIGRIFVWWGDSFLGVVSVKIAEVVQIIGLLFPR
jgi:hypothetical protein